MKTVALCPNPKRDSELRYTKEALDILRKNGFTCVLTYPFETDAPTGGLGIPFLPLAEAVARADLLITLGGDGTILRVAPHAARQACPILAVNVGHLGFICDLEMDEVSLIEKLRGEEWKIERRMMLDVSVQREGRAIYNTLALNEAVVNKGAVSRVVNLGVDINGERMLHLRGDGLIAATATGSTGYSRSAGGPVMSPNIRGIIMTPVCPMNLPIGSWVLEAGDVLTVESMEKNYVSGFLSVDGGRAFSLHRGDTVEIRCSKFETQLLRLKGRGFFDEYERKMGTGGVQHEK